MIYQFASRRQLSFIVSAGGRKLLVAFGDRNMAGVAVFMTTDEKVAHAIRRHSLTRRGVIEETTKPVVDESLKPAGEATGTVSKDPSDNNTEAKEREYDNYTVARERICKEFGIKKEKVRNPTALARVAKEHGVIITYKQL